MTVVEMTILERLRKETQELHKAIESALPVMRPGFQLPEYRRLMARFYGFYLPIEKQLCCVPHLEAALPDWRQRRKTEWLLRDLYALGFTGHEIENLPSCAHALALASLPEALGCLYVLEGSTLGGQIISRHLQATLGLGPGNGGAFFCGYGRQVGPMWKAFQAALPLAVPLEEEHRAINSAKQTFHWMNEWLLES